MAAHHGLTYCFMTRLLLIHYNTLKVLEYVLWPRLLRRHDPPGIRILLCPPTVVEAASSTSHRRPCWLRPRLQFTQSLAHCSGSAGIDPQSKSLIDEAEPQPECVAPATDGVSFFRMTRTGRLSVPHNASHPVPDAGRNFTCFFRHNFAKMVPGT